MATTVEFLRDYGVEIRANGQKRWPDEVKAQIMRLSTDLGPTSGVSTSSVGRFIDSAANARKHFDKQEKEKRAKGYAEPAGVAGAGAGGAKKAAAKAAPPPTRRWASATPTPTPVRWRPA